MFECLQTAAFKFSLRTLLVAITFEVCAVNGSKYRSWVGPDTFFEGQLPSPRQGHAMVSSDDGVLYLFGGWGNSGERFKFNDNTIKEWHDS